MRHLLMVGAIAVVWFPKLPASANDGGSLGAPCPLTPAGARGETVEVDGRVAVRYLSEGSGQGRWASWDQDRWLQFQSDCRIVGLRNSGGSGSLFSTAHFAVQTNQPAPSTAEQRALLEWAGATLVGPNDPMAQLAQLREFPAGPEARNWDQEHRAPYVRCAPPGDERIGSARRPISQWRDVWLPYTISASQLEEDQWAAHCPCYKRFQGSALRRKDLDVAALPPGLRLLRVHSGFRNDTHVVGLLEDRTQRVRWLALHRGTIRVLGSHGDKIWLTTTDTSMDIGPTSLVVLDTRSLRAQACLVLGGTTGVAQPDPRGIRYDAQGDERNFTQLFTWGDLEQERLSASRRPRLRWRSVVEGVDYAEAQVVQEPLVGDGKFHLVRIDPYLANFVAAASTTDATQPRTAAQWSRERDMPVVFNAGMFEEDHRTHTGVFRFGTHVNSEKWIDKYKTVLVSRWIDQAKVEVLDTEGLELDDSRTDLVVQNLRLVRRPGRNVWPQSPRQWSEVALAAASNGDIIVVFSRSPLSMHDFNARLLGLGLSIEAAMHLEGGPEASLSIHGGGIDLDLAGSYETGFLESDSNQRQWPLPNVLGVGRPDVKR